MKQFRPAANQAYLDIPSFDELMKLASENPEQFNTLKKELCRQLIDTSSDEMKPRLEAQQTHIDRVLSKAKNPVHANVLLRQELHRQIVKFSQALTGEDNKQPANATVISFPTKESWR
jgi:phage I-like protein